MKTNENNEILNDLIRINNDRATGYEKAARETEAADQDLRSIFNSMASESHAYVSELSRYVMQSGEAPTDSTTVSGKIYRAWMDIKAAFTGKDRKSILESCEFGEDAAQKAYKETLQSDAGLRFSSDIREMITRQKEKLKASHDRIKLLRDAQPA
ncbi:MAG: PA2169 family four-helix-bundle protein [Sphingobacteriales bacterium]|nr:PA2169 family four-helix-bundle protein [Sphingobacteriales bacterium]OJY91076.1 MAG: aldehyde dehydrogenase [Sphingobacteriales bacterium 44-15]